MKHPIDDDNYLHENQYTNSKRCEFLTRRLHDLTELKNAINMYVTQFIALIDLSTC